ncbi:MAG: hypothetical protein NZ989_09360, partial [Bacteroidia bacterium]|nr:hypothetical protein [Bacteroidia bacterium]MDW8058345.1 hypothetical protein [Bacteroidia bacterium]
MRYQKLQVCAWRVKYLILLEAPLEPYEWRALERLWEGSRLEIFVLGHETVLYKLTLPERKGMVTGSSISSELYAVFLRS